MTFKYQSAYNPAHYKMLVMILRSDLNDLIRLKDCHHQVNI